MRLDMASRQTELAIQQKWETRKFVVQLVAGLGTAFASGAAALGLLLHLLGKL